MMRKFMDGDMGHEVFERYVAVCQFHQDRAAEQPDHIGAMGYIVGRFFCQRDTVIKAGDVHALALRVLSWVKQVIGQPVGHLQHDICRQRREWCRQVGDGALGNGFDFGQLCHGRDMDIEGRV